MAHRASIRPEVRRARPASSPTTATASGVAALIISKNGGKMSPASVYAALKAPADDLGSKGRDSVFDHGGANAYNAVT